MSERNDMIGKKVVPSTLGWSHILKFDSPIVLLYVEKGTQHFVVCKMYKAPDIYYEHKFYDIDSALEFFNRYVEREKNSKD
jgi:hypothetical protein